MQRQFPGLQQQSRDGRYKFILGMPVEGEEYDFWVIQGKGIRQKATAHVARENTIFLSTEPRTVLDYPKDYLQQFGLVCTCQPQTKGSNVVLAPPVLPWYVGNRWNTDKNCYEYTLDYDALANIHPDKSKLLSVITSNKAFTRGHVHRIHFVERLKQHFGNRLDIFGHGFNSFNDKFDVLAPYKYHIVIENVSQDYYWTEKLSDAFLAECLPIYHGCTNVNNYFSQQAMVNININNPDETIATIESVMAANEWEVRRSAIMQAKELALNKYNMFEVSASLCDRLNADAPKQLITMHPCHSMNSWHNVRNYLFTRSLFQLEQRIHNIFHSDSLLATTLDD